MSTKSVASMSGAYASRISSMSFKLDKTQKPSMSTCTGAYLQRALFLEGCLWTQACEEGLKYAGSLGSFWPHEALAKAQETSWGRHCLRWLACALFEEVKAEILEVQKRMFEEPRSPQWEDRFSQEITDPAVKRIRAWIEAQESAWEAEVTFRLIQGGFMDANGQSFDAHTLHQHSIRNRDEVLRSALCGCFNCLQTYPPTSIRDWIEGDQTALCPRCGLDAVLGSEAGIEITVPLLEAMNRYWLVP